MSDRAIIGSYEAGVQSGAKQVIDYLEKLIADERVRFDQLAQRVSDLHRDFGSGAFYAMTLDYKPSSAALGEIGGEG